MAQATHTSTVDNSDKIGGGVLDIFKSACGKYRIMHFSAHRGGCLYAGWIDVTSVATQKRFRFNSTSGPYNPNGKYVSDGGESTRRYMNGLAIKHALKVA